MMNIAKRNNAQLSVVLDASVQEVVHALDHLKNHIQKSAPFNLYQCNEQNCKKAIPREHETA